MKTSIEWLKEYADINVSAKELADLLTLTGTKVETIEEKGGGIKNVVIGKILSIEKHPNADKLVVTKVDVKSEILQIVTGAPNVKEGAIVALAKHGASLQKGLLQIRTSNLRGMLSQGMLCSVGELGLTTVELPDQIENGIMILNPKYEANLGEDFTEALKLKETIIDFEITPNRPDCLSVEGLGRETAVSLNVPFKAPHKHLDNMQVPNKDDIEDLTVKISAPDLCYRYIARVVKNVVIKESPDWMKRRLIACDVKPHNNIVDITNYVMLEMGQPMHAFDIRNIEGKVIDVRKARKGETITTLDEIEQKLDEEMLVIADSKNAVAVAGVMGGLKSGISDDTTTVVFESAVFNGPSVRKTSKKMNLRTEASSRFEKGLSVENAQRAMNRAVELVELLECGVPVEGKIDVYSESDVVENNCTIEFDADVINKFLGISISKEEMENIFKKLDFKVEGNKVIPPYYRRDVAVMADLAEEIIRIYGYDKLPSTLIDSDTTVGEKTKLQKIESLYRWALKDYGLSEIYTYGFINEKDFENTNMDFKLLEKEIVKIKNPLNDEYTVMRTSTVPSMMKILSINNSKKNKNVKLFDISRIYRDVAEKVKDGEIPLEEKILTIGMYGEDVDFYSLKGIIENLLETAGIVAYDIVKEKENKTYHPGRTANLKVGMDVFATFGEIHPIVCENFEIAERVFVAEINIDKVTRYAKQNKKYTEIAKYPAVERDMALVVSDEIEVGEIEKIIKKKAKNILESCILFDVYKSDKIGEGKKSVAYSLQFRLKDRTLTDDEVNVVMNDVCVELDKALGAKIRA
ncbi:MAG: phenylalanine--tRNA ligase subunit beta [Oscillospiraceae bacterium]|nr:phenylalanine--tRNA ligase subunit beta [Oscillospiraceae bacterium]